MNEKQQRLMQQITEKSLSDKMRDWKKSETLSSQHSIQYRQLKEYYQAYLNDQENKNNQAQNARMVSNTHYFLSHLQRMLMLQRTAVQKCERTKEKCCIEWKKQQAKRRYLRYLKWLKWEEEENAEEEMNNRPKKET